MGNVYLAKRNYNEALRYFGPIANVDPCYYYILGYLAYERGDLLEAKQNLIKSLGRDFKFIQSLYYLGMVYRKMGQPDLAAEMFSQALRSYEPDEGAFKMLAAEQLRQLK